MFKPFVTVVALTASAAALEAQGAQLIGLTRDTPLLRTQDPVTCAHTNGCDVDLPPANLPWAGGTAYDSTTGGVWVSTGRQLAKVDPGSCTPQCGPFPMVDSNVTPTSPVVTGLAMSESTGELLAINSAGTLIRLALGVGDCPPPFDVTRCNTGLQGTNTASTTGLAVDELNGLLFISYADFANGGTKLLVADQADPCTIFHSEEVPPCPDHPMGPVTGLAVDWCEQIVFATDGRHTQKLKYRLNSSGIDPRIAFERIGCCSPDLSTIADPMIGLALTPTPVRPFGESCANGSCRPCGTMRHKILNGPTIGNPNLVFALERAKANEPVWLAIGLGECAVGPTPYPLCGPILVGLGDIRPLVVGPFWPYGTVGCTGTLQLPVPVPLLPMCGSVWSSQFVQACFDGVDIGTAMSNCVTFQLGS